jgi:pyridoxamine 5'-phosphate oxidase
LVNTYAFKGNTFQIELPFVKNKEDRKIMNNEIFEQYGNDPITLCQSWLDEAFAQEPNDPEAACLATSTAQGRPSNRFVLVKEVSTRGLKFHTNRESRKGEELTTNPYAAITFYWKSTRKQVRIEGEIKELSEAESDEYFATRSRERRIGAWVSQQSRPYDSLDDMKAAQEKYTQEFAHTENIPRPPYWKGFLLVPASMEFWIGNKDRLHTRFVYTRDNGGAWNASWLWP